MVEAYTNYYDSSKLLHGSRTPVMGTCLDALLIGKDKEEALKIWKEIETEVIRLDKLLNRFDPESALSMVNKQAAIHPVTVTEELFSVLADCKRYHCLTSGYFDISLHNRMDSLFLEEEHHRVFFQKTAMELDMGGYGKGYALEKIKDILSKHNITHALINFGNSSVLAVGTHLYGDHWAIGITDPATGETRGNIRMKDNTLSVSGNSPRNPVHIIDPSTGNYYKGKQLVAIVAPHAVDAEVLSTSLLLADEKERKNILARFTIDSWSIF